MKNEKILPVGLKGREINNRILELMGESVKPIENKNSVVELTKLGPDGNIYGVVRENHEYYIKISDNKPNLVLEDFKYIGGLKNKKDEVYPTYAKAIKHLNLKFLSLKEAYNVKTSINIFEDDNLVLTEVEDKDNPWAICTASVGREDMAKYERCVLDVKKQLGIEENLSEDNYLAEAIEKGKFTNWCEKHGFENGASISCAKEAMKEKYGPDVHKMATFYMNTVQPKGKTMADINEEDKELSPKQKEIAKLGGDPDEIDSIDFKILRSTKKLDEAQNLLSSIDELLKKKIVNEAKYKLKIDRPVTSTQTKIDDVDNNEPKDELLPPPVEDKPSDDKPFDDEPFDAGVETSEEENPKKFIQQLAGKIGQSLRKYTDESGNPDFELEKYVVNSVIAATHTGSMPLDDQKDIISKVKKSGKNVSEPEEEDSEDIDINASDDEIDVEKTEVEDDLNETEVYHTNYENSELKHEGFFINVYNIYESVCEMLKMDKHSVDRILSNGHGWALDHIATATNDMEQVYHYIEPRLSHIDESEHENYMFFQNLKTLKHVTKHILYMDEYMIDDLISNDDYWLLNLVSRSVDDVEEVYHFLSGILGYVEEFEYIDDEQMYNLYETVKKKLSGDKKYNFNVISEAEYKGRKVELNKPKRGGIKKFYVYVKDGDKVKKVSFGAKSGGGKLAVKLNDPKARKAFADRHNCEEKTDKTKPGYWACRLPRFSKSLSLSGGGTWW